MISKNRTKTPYTTILLMIPLSSALFSPSRLLLLHCNHRSGQRTIFSSVRSSYNRGHSVGRFGSSDTRTRHNQHIKVNNKSGVEGIFSSYIHTARTLLFSLMNDIIRITMMLIRSVMTSTSKNSVILTPTSSQRILHTELSTKTCFLNSLLVKR